MVRLFPLFFCFGVSQFLPPALSFSPSFAPGAQFVPRSTFTAPFAGFAFNEASWFAPERASVYNPNPVPPDPTADRALTNRLTKYTDVVIADKKGDAQIAAIYDQSSFRNFNLEITSDNVDIMQAAPSKEKKVHCRITFDYNTPQAKTFGGFGVGCGYKGSVGSLRICLDENNKDNGGCRKLSLRVENNAFKIPNATNPTFYGAKNLLFNGMPVDWSLMSERTAYNLLNSLNIASPLASHAKLFLNGKYLGVYAFVQDVDSVFTKQHWGKDKNKGKGSLYKDLWLNDLHMQELGKDDTQKDDNFMREVFANMQATPQNAASAKAFFDKYFDMQSFIDTTAVNAIIGSTDDWRLRHNFFWYVREDKGQKKLVFIPWDYDRLYDQSSGSRGALHGQPWWDIAGGDMAGGGCNHLIQTPEQQANAIGGTPAKIAYNVDIFRQYPPDMAVPVTCDKFIQLLAVAYAPKVRARTIELAGKVSVTKIKANWAIWSAQIQDAVNADPDGPNPLSWQDEQRKLETSLTTAKSRAVREANQGDAAVSFAGSFAPAPLPTTSFGTTSFGTTFGTPFGTTSFGTTFGTPAASFSGFGSSNTFGTFGTPSTFGTAFARAPAPLTSGFGFGIGAGR